MIIAMLSAGVALSAIMALAWVIQQRSDNSGWVDVSWSLGVGSVAFLVALYPMQASWPHWRQLAVAILALCWSLRLGVHIAGRARGVADDPRYRDLITEWGANAQRRMFRFLQSQAAVGAVLVISIGLAAHNPDPKLRAFDLIGIALLIGAIVGESVADRQLRLFKAKAESQGKVCDMGLWRWSRHPNYFFEWLYWVGVAVTAIDAGGYNPYGWLALAAPVSMYWVLVHVSGIPPLEAHMLRSRGDEFRAYQRRTSAFFPFPPSTYGGAP